LVSLRCIPIIMALPPNLWVDPMGFPEMHSVIGQIEGVNHVRFSARDFLRHRLQRPIVFALGIANRYIQCAGKNGLRLEWRGLKA
jgi:hypothetical protein